MNYVALDVGNVLVHVDFSIFTRELSAQLNLSMEEAEYFLNRTCRLHDLGLTKMSDELRDHFKIKSQVIIDKLLSKWNEVIWPSRNVLNHFNKMIAKDDLKIALLSNVGLEHSVVMENTLGNLFSGAVKHLSCLVGARKPNKLYYQSFLLQYPEFKGCAYLDDLEENLEASKQFGFRTYHFALDKHTSLPHFRDVSKDKLAQIRNFIVNT